MVSQSVDYPRAYQANALVRAPLKLSNVEARLFALALGCIHQGQTELPGISIPMSKVIRQKKGGSVYETIREACKGLMSKIVSIEAKNKSKNRFTAYSIISFMDINEGTGLITGAWEVDFEVLRKQMLGDDNEKTYTIFHDFKRYVLEPSLREIHALGWLVSYAALKEGKKVRAIRFSIPETNHEALSSDSPSSPLAIKGEREARNSQPIPDKQMTLNLSADSPTVQQRVVTRLQKLKLTPAQIQHVLQYLGDDEPKLAKLMKATHPLLR
nr:hypothetical protein [Tanacetum cinerariifolium]